MTTEAVDLSMSHLGTKGYIKVYLDWIFWPINELRDSSMSWDFTLAWFFKLKRCLLLRL